MTQSLPFKGLHVLGIGYGLTTLATRSGSADLLLGSEPEGLAVDFTSSLWLASAGKYGDVRIRSTTSPSLAHYGPPINKLSYSAPSAKWTRRASGLIAEWTAGADLPFEWGSDGQLAGVLMEPQATNLALRSNDFANASWNKSLGPVTITANSETSPDGGTNAHRIVEANASTNHGIFQSFTTVNGSRYTMSAWLKAGTRTWARFTEGASVSAAVWFNLSTGAIGTTSGTGSPTGRIEAFPGGWYRCSMSFTAGSTSANIQIRLAAADGGGSYAGDGTGYVIGYGAQVELGSVPTSYVPTVAATVTRAADNLSLATTAFPFSASTGTLAVSYRYQHTDVSTTQALLALTAGSTFDEEHLISIFAASDSYQIRDGAVAVGSCAPSGTVTAGATTSVAAAYAADDAAMVRNGGTPATDNSLTLPMVDLLRFAARATAFSVLPVTLRTARYFPRRRANAELQSMTA